MLPMQGSTKKDRNGMDLTEAEVIKKRWQEYTEELYKEELHDPDNHNGAKGSNPGRLHWEHGVLATGPPGNILLNIILIFS